MFQIIEYIKFLWHSKNEHGVHSPFVFDLVTNCFYDTSNHADYSKIKSYRNHLLSNSKTITITDAGSGSKVFPNNERRINQIAKTSGTTYKRAKLLYRLVNYFKPQYILELGASLGISTYTMAIAGPTPKITSIEGCLILSDLAKNQLQDLHIKNVTLKTGTFSEVLPKLIETNWDMVFFDGHHDKHATLDYFQQLLPQAHNDAVFIFDDIHWSKGMTEAWESIKSHPKVTVTIDTFYWGFVFFRKEQAKEHFVIRI